jgi:tRNA pseudouridine55 synthase
MKNKEDYLSGELLLIDKPLNWTSFQVVNKLRWQLKKVLNIKKIKVGHAGTLDPLATGLLLICTGKMTKKIALYQGLKKVYIGRFVIGATTPSYDMETAINQRFPVNHITPKLLRKTAAKFTGDIFQKPPLFSAIKKDGKRLYELARAGQTTEIEARKITIDHFQLTQITQEFVEFEVSCSKGTYIRSLVHDFGQAIGSGAYLSQLRRTRIGSYKVEESMTIDSFLDQTDRL